MIQYIQTQNQISNPEIPEIKGYQKQFFINKPQGDVEKPVIEKPITEPIEEEVTEEPSSFTDQELNVLLNDGTSKEKAKVASKYLQQNLNLTKEQASSLIGVWQSESGFNLNAENKAEKAGKSRYVKSDEYGIGIGQWTGDRHKDYTNYINNNGGVNNLKTQLDFAINEIKTKYSDYLTNLQSAKSVRDATAYTYVQYVGSNQKNIKDLDDLYKRVMKLENKYASVHKELYGKSGSGSFERRVRNAEQSIYAKYGAKLKRK